MTRVLVTGMSGSGKSTLLAGLAGRGYATLDTDYGGWVLDDGRWDEPRLRALLAASDTLVVSGTVDNQGELYDLFDHVVLLSAPLETLIERVGSRTSNPYGSSPADRAQIQYYLRTVEPLLRAGATLELDGRNPPAALIDAVAALLDGETG